MSIFVPLKFSVNIYSAESSDICIDDYVRKASKNVGEKNIFKEEHCTLIIFG